MTDIPGQLVVRTYAPARYWLTRAALALLGIFALYVVYELGRFDAGYDRLAVAQQRRELEVDIERLEKSQRELRVQLAELETLRVSQTRERAEVARTIGELQAQVARQEQELAFFRGIVAQASQAPEVKIQQLRILAHEGKPDAYDLRLTLVQAVRPDNVVSGAVRLKVEGTRAGAAASLGLEALSEGAKPELPFSFRYFENLDQTVQLPADFKPERIAVEVSSSRKNVPPATRAFIWSVAAR